MNTLKKKPRLRGLKKVFTVINPIAGELLSSRAHFLFGFMEVKVLKKITRNLDYNIEGTNIEPDVWKMNVRQDQW